MDGRETVEAVGAEQPRNLSKPEAIWAAGAQKKIHRKAARNLARQSHGAEAPLEAADASRGSSGEKQRTRQRASTYYEYLPGTRTGRVSWINSAGTGYFYLPDGEPAIPRYPNPLPAENSIPGSPHPPARAPGGSGNRPWYELHQGYEYGEHSEYRSVRGESSTVQYLRLFPALYRTRTSSHAQIDFFYPQRHTVQKWLYVTSLPNPRCQLHASATRTSRILINTPKPDRCHGLNRVKANAKNKPLSETPGVKHQTLPEYRIATTQQSVLPARYGNQYEYPILNPEFRNE